jgi:subtilisin family serine protease
MAICGGQWAGWFAGQLALASASLEILAVTDRVGQGIEAVVVLIVAGAATALSKGSLRPVYRSWLSAAAFMVPAAALRFLGPNQGQLGALLQILLAGGAAVIVWAVFRPSRSIGTAAWGTALIVVPLVVWPFLLWGAVGSGADILLNGLAGLAFGALAAGLSSANSGSFVLDGLGAGVLLAILSSAFGYNGSQLVLMAVLPPLGFASAALASSPMVAALTVGLVAAAPLVFVDSTELTIILGDLGPWIARAALSGAVLSLAAGVIARAILMPRSRFAHPAMLFGGGVIGWSIVIAVFLLWGPKGYYGDRLFVIMKGQADVSSAYHIGDLVARRNFVYRTLTAHARKSQANLRSTLDRWGIVYQPYYLVNAIEVNGGLLMRLYLASRPDVERVLDSPRLRPLPQPARLEAASQFKVNKSPGWNVTMLHADKVWQEFGVTGQGVTVGQSDTGVDGHHPALRKSYRGLDNNNDFNWYDPWNHSSFPTDAQGHGTHTLGSVLGTGGIGVAPGARWIGCVNLARNLGNPAVYLTCLQFMLAPFPQAGDPMKDGDPAKAADVLNNSWGCPPLEGCDPEVLSPAAVALRAAGIFVVVSAGNDGPSCETVNAPMALYDSVLSVGAVDQAGALADFSSRGPVTVDGSRRTKPDVAAPGVEVLSAWPGGGYNLESGTSMAGPQVVGVVALLWSAKPALLGDIDRTTQILEATARSPASQSRVTLPCGSRTRPDNLEGYGIVDAYAAVKMALGK